MTDEELIARLRGWAKDIREGSTAIWAMDQDVKQAADRIEALVKYCDAYAEMERIATEALRKSEARAERLEAALQFYSCKDGCNDCSENERDLIGCGWTARAALKGADHE